MKKIMYKIVLLSVSATLFTGLLVGISLYYFIDNIFTTQIKKNTDLLYENFDRVIVYEVNTVISLLEKIKSMEDKGELTKEQAQDFAKKIIRDLRYEKEGYFWIDDYDGNNVVLLGKAVEGTNRLNLQDVKGKYLIKELIEKARAGGGFTDYWFPRPGDTAAAPKRGYSKAFEPYRWVVGTGNYIDDIEKINNQNVEKANKEKAEISFYIVAILLITIAIVIVLSILLSKKISNPIVEITNAAKELSKGRMVDNLQVKTKDEVLDLANAFNLMKSKISKVIEETRALAKAASDGRLDYRAKAQEFEGSYKDIVEGINQAIDNLIRPLNVTAEYIDRISKGDIPPKIEEEYRGDFNEIKNNINQCIDAINLLLKDTYELVDNATEGRITYRANGIRHLGDFRRLIEGINATLDRLVGLIDNMPVPVQIVDRNNNVLYRNNTNESLIKNL
ncbi:MAG: cache domain-containing protein [Bacteroidota bacterium]